MLGIANFPLQAPVLYDTSIRLLLLLLCTFMHIHYTTFYYIWSYFSRFFHGMSRVRTLHALYLFIYVYNYLFIGVTFESSYLNIVNYQSVHPLEQVPGVLINI